MISEKQFNKTATTDAFDEIYTNFDVSTISNEYLADSGYPFDFPTRWLNDPSMNKRIAIRRLDVIPSSHSFALSLSSSDPVGTFGLFTKTANINITEYDNLIKALSYICDSLSVYDETKGEFDRRLVYEYNEKENRLKLRMDGIYIKTRTPLKFNLTNNEGMNDSDIVEFLEFLNQPINNEMINYMKETTTEKVFDNVWSRDRLYIHASFSTSRRKYIGKRGDFYQNMNLLYPLPSNESIFHVFFTSDGKKTILIRYCNFDIQLCFIVNYKKSVVL